MISAHRCSKNKRSSVFVLLLFYWYKGKDVDFWSIEVHFNKFQSLKFITFRTIVALIMKTRFLQLSIKLIRTIMILLITTIIFDMWHDYQILGTEPSLLFSLFH
jgi:hypothetical protein